MPISLAQARRIALAAQGFGRPRPTRPTMRHLQGLIERIGLFQIDSVNVLARAHLLPAYSRLGRYDTALFERAGTGRPPRLVEFWAHEAALIPPSTYDLMGPRRADFAAQSRFWGAVLAEQRGLADEVLEMLAAGPMTARQIHDALGHQRGPKDHWGWNWTTAKRVAEALFATGGAVVARRTAQFERLYDLPGRVLGARPDPPPREEADVELVRIAARALGIGTVGCLADYFRMRPAAARTAVARLVAVGELEQVAVQGWTRPGFLHAAAARPRRVNARALLAPFDPLVWERRRLLELFGMHYRIGIYTPAAKREHGYYVLPFLLGDRLVARVDLKADRKASRLLVRTAFAEPAAPPHTAVELAAELAELAQWLGLGGIALDEAPRGDLVAPLAKTL